MPVLPILSLYLPRKTLPVLPERAIPVFQIPDAVVSMPAQVAIPQSQPIQWLELGLAIWLVGSAVLLLRYGFALCQIAGLVRRSRRLRSGLVESDYVSIPLTFWFGRHFVVLPSQWRTWTRERRRSVFRHELAHVRRGDWFVQSTALVIRALFWPNPFAWILAKEVRSLSERAADDLVLDSGVEPSRYAQDLLEIAREVGATIPAMALPMAFRADVARRIEMVLKSKVQRGRVTLAGLFGSALLVAAFAVPVATWGLAPRMEPQQAQAASKGGPMTVSVVLPHDGVGLNVPYTKLNLPSREGRVKDASMGSIVAFALSQPLRERILNEWTASKGIHGSPVLRTTSGQAATIDRPNAGIYVGVVPTQNADGTTTLSARLRLNKPGKAAFQGGVEAVLEKGVNSVIIVRMEGGKVADVLALLTVSAG
jgi:beta-lactamase regulating signal transducer with metallopeptidase domain